MLRVAPAVAVAGLVTTKEVAGAGETAMAPVIPVIDELPASVAETVWLAAVFRIIEKVFVPLDSVASAGSTADASVLVR